MINEMKEVLKEFSQVSILQFEKQDKFNATIIEKLDNLGSK